MHTATYCHLTTDTSCLISASSERPSPWTPFCRSIFGVPTTYYALFQPALNCLILSCETKHYVCSESSNWVHGCMGDTGTIVYNYTTRVLFMHNPSNDLTNSARLYIHNTLVDSWAIHPTIESTVLQWFVFFVQSIFFIISVLYFFLSHSNKSESLILFSTPDYCILLSKEHILHLSWSVGGCCSRDPLVPYTQY